MTQMTQIIQLSQFPKSPAPQTKRSTGRFVNRDPKPCTSTSRKRKLRTLNPLPQALNQKSETRNDPKP